jgi:hypothetical protein
VEARDPEPPEAEAGARGPGWGLLLVYLLLVGALVFWTSTRLVGAAPTR